MSDCYNWPCIDACGIQEWVILISFFQITVKTLLLVNLLGRHCISISIKKTACQWCIRHTMMQAHRSYIRMYIYLNWHTSVFNARWLVLHVHRQITGKKRASQSPAVGAIEPVRAKKVRVIDPAKKV